MVKDVHQNAITDDAWKIRHHTSNESASLRKKTARRKATPNIHFRREVFPLRTGLAAATLFLVGSILIFLSTLIGIDEENRGLSFFILGFMAFIPGSYASYQLYGAWKGWKGYHYDQIPSYDD